jgi:hypothetical protein
VGHFDLITKFDELHDHIFLNNQEYLDVAGEYIKYAAGSGCIFEMNTGAISRGVRKTFYLQEKLLGILKDCGTRITVTSDSHRADTLDASFVEVKKYLKVRDANYNIVGQITQGTQVDVKGKSDQWSDRSVIPYDCDGGLATVLTSGLRKVHTSSKSDNASTGQEDAYWAATTRSTPLRSKDGSIVCNIPRAARIKVLQVNGKDKSMLDVIYDDKSGCVPAKSVKRVKDGVSVDINHQKVALIRKGKIILTSKCVTGTLNKKDTPKGIFKVGEKHENKVFHPSEKKSLYWCRIGHTRCGFHDARWRRNWSSSCYKTSGSDGCVNMQLSPMGQFYKNVYVGLYVYIS